MPDPPSTVAAIITPPGEGGIGIVQVVGPNAAALTAPLFQPAGDISLAACPPGRLLYGRIVDEGRMLDEVIVTCWNAEECPGGEATVEINCHGGIAAVNAVLKAVVARGAQKVTWQQLLSRTVATGRLDAVQAEAMLRLTEARSRLAAGMLLDQMQGALSREFRAAAELFETEQAPQAESKLRALLATAALGRALVEPRRVIIAGAPNVGKSTLFNALVGHARVIVADLPGTTRDAIAETIVLDGVPFELTDTAGLRDTDHLVEIESVKGTWRRLAAADIVVLLFDGSRVVLPDEWRVLADIRRPKLVPAINKCDLQQAIDCGEVETRCGAAPCRLSASNGAGLAELEARLMECIPGRADYRPGAAVVFTEQQIEAIRDALDAPHARAAERLRRILPV